MLEKSLGNFSIGMLGSSFPKGIPFSPLAFICFFPALIFLGCGVLEHAQFDFHIF